MSKRERYYLSLAIQEARRHRHNNRYHLCAIIAKGSRIISIGFNSYKTHPKSPMPYHLIHAEIDALIGIDQEKLKGTTMYVARVGYKRRSRICMSKPCKYCQSVILRSGVRRVIFTIEEGETGEWDIRNNEWNRVEKRR